MKHVFHPSALQEYSEAVEYYARKGVKLSQNLINEVEDAIFRVIESPYSYAVVDKKIRRCLTRKLPYAIEKLRGNLSGYYSRRINKQHRLIYQKY